MSTIEVEGMLLVNDIRKRLVESLFDVQPPMLEACTRPRALFSSPHQETPLPPLPLLGTQLD